MVLKQVGVQFDTEEIERFKRLLPGKSFGYTARQALTEYLDRMESDI